MEEKNHLVCSFIPYINSSAVPVCCQLCGNIGEGPFLIQHDKTLMHNARCKNKLLSHFVVEELDLPAESPNLNPNEQDFHQV